MDHNKFKPAHHQILKDLNNKAAERKAKKRENSLLAFVMTATARDNEKNILINKLRKEACNHLEAVRLLQIENEIKDNLLKLKDEELESLKSENEKLQIALKNADHISEAASTVNNILVASPKRELVISDSPVSTSNNDPPVESPKPSGRKRRVQLKKETNYTYNLRKKKKQK